MCGWRHGLVPVTPNDTSARQDAGPHSDRQEADATPAPVASLDPEASARRFETLLDGGRKIASALSREEVFAAVRDAAALLGGKRCLLLEVPEGGPLEEHDTLPHQPGSGLDEASRRLVEQAVAAKAPVVNPEGRALCAPILVRERAAACLYVSHAEPAVRFGTQERQVAAYVTTLAGAALENAEGFAAVQELTRSLEVRVEERTAQLREAFEREREAAEQLKHQAFHDSLTNLANRALFADRVEHALHRARRLDSTIALLLLDLDDFKTVNDSMGHAVGDELLVAVAKRLDGFLRESDTAARLGGDEFAVLLEDVPEPADAAHTAQRIIDALEQPFELGGRKEFVHASVGVALGGAGAGAGALESGDLLRNADVAMYIAKWEGKRRYAFFRPSLHASVLERLELKGDLQRALEHDEFVVEYQPIVDLQTGRVRGMEALVRWRHPARGVKEPAQFVPLAEETGLILPIGNWVLGEACRQMSLWHGAYDPLLAIHVNLSPRQLYEPGLTEAVAAVLDRTGVPPERLMLEITESVFMRDTDATKAKLAALRELGVRLAIDDFGTGYAALDYLKRFPIDAIKVAKPFVDDVASVTANPALARAIVRLGETFGLETIAEGIERPEQALRLRDMGCPLGQGFHYARPLAAGAAESLLKKGGELASPLRLQPEG
jgi:diguanylate cyclase (GGDEF)-like protein